MKTLKKYFWQLLVLGLIIIIFLQNSCENKIDNSNVIITPPKESGFDYIKPDEIDKPDYIYITTKGDTVRFQNPLNKELKNKYDSIAKTNDSLQLKLLYYTAIQNRSYKKVFDNKDITATVFAETTGTLDSLRFDYIIKPDTIPVKKTVFRLLAGPSLDFNPITFKTNLGANIGIENKNGNVITLGVNTNKDFRVGYLFNLWDYKK